MMSKSVSPTRSRSSAFLAAVFAIFAVGAVAVVPSEVGAQCFICDLEDNSCESGGGGSSCGQSFERDEDGRLQQVCKIEGGCRCVRRHRGWWFDETVCTPTLASSQDVRHVEEAGSVIAVRRVGERHFAALACGSDRWVVLARELPNGDLSVTKNPLVIRFQRWRLGLRAAGAAADQ